MPSIAMLLRGEWRWRRSAAHDPRRSDPPSGDQSLRARERRGVHSWRHRLSYETGTAAQG